MISMINLISFAFVSHLFIFQLMNAVHLTHPSRHTYQSLLFAIQWVTARCFERGKFHGCSLERSQLNSLLASSIQPTNQSSLDELQTLVENRQTIIGMTIWNFAFDSFLITIFLSIVWRAEDFSLSLSPRVLSACSHLFSCSFDFCCLALSLSLRYFPVQCEIFLSRRAFTTCALTNGPSNSL